MSDYAIEVTDLHKSFKLPTEKAGKLKTAAVNLVKGVHGYKEQKVLRGINFKVKKGEFFGIVGRNGSGKSTLLKIISRIYEPTKGSVKAHGKLVPFIELGVGFNPELTGRENVYLNGALLGFSNEEIDGLYDEVVDFAELHEFMDQKLKNYSSGMQVRLAFSLAIRSSADILVLDEVLAVGDEAFQKKCNAYFTEQKKNKKTIILVTHSMDIVKEYCSRAILIDNGQITHEGKPFTIADAYLALFNSRAPAQSNEALPTQSRWGIGGITFNNIKINRSDSNLKISFDVESSLQQTEEFQVVMKFADQFDDIIAGTSLAPLTKGQSKYSIRPNECKKFELNFTNIFGDGIVVVQPTIQSPNGSTVYDSINSGLHFANKTGKKYFPIYPRGEVL